MNIPINQLIYSNFGLSIGIALFVMAIISYFKIQATRDRYKPELKFYPLAILLAVVQVASLIFLNNFMGWLFIGNIFIWIMIVLNYGLWAITLYEIGGEEKVVWFYLVSFLSPFWIIYRLTEIA